MGKLILFLISIFYFYFCLNSNLYLHLHLCVNIYICICICILTCFYFRFWFVHSIAKGSCNGFAASLSIAKWSCNVLDLLYYEGVSQLLLSKNIRTCLDVWAKQKLLIGTLSLNDITWLDVRMLGVSGIIFYNVWGKQWRLFGFWYMVGLWYFDYGRMGSGGFAAVLAFECFSTGT